MFTPLSNNDRKVLKELFQKKGFSNDTEVDNYFRYSISDENVITITIKKPIVLPLRLNVPFEIVSFKFSTNLKIRVIDNSTFENINYLIDKMREIGIESNLEHEFPLEGREKNLVQILNMLIPETMINETEQKWINRIRVFILNKQSKFKEFDNKISANVNASLNNLGFIATNELPWELVKGLPNYRSNNVIFFKNIDSNDEYLVLERGFITYYNDFYFKNIFIRCQWTSYTPYILLQLYKDENFNLELLITSWIKFSRLMLNSIINIVESDNINKLNIQSFNFQHNLLKFDERSTFPLIPLNYESVVSKNLTQVEYELLSNPPSNFEEIEALDLYEKALEKFKGYKFSEAMQMLFMCMKTFNKYKQRKIVILTLLYLSDIAQNMRQYDKSTEYLENGLESCKEGGIPLPLIIKIHNNLGSNLIQMKRLSAALTHYRIVISFLEDNQEELENREILADTYLNVAKIHLNQDNLADGKLFFNKALNTAPDSISIQLKYLYERAKYNMSKEKLSHAIKLLKQSYNILGQDESNAIKYKQEVLKINKLLAKIFIYNRKDVKSAQVVLNEMKKLISKETIFGIKMTMSYYKLQADFHKFLLKDVSMSKYFVDQADNVKVQLKVIGIPL